MAVARLEACSAAYSKRMPHYTGAGPGLDSTAETETAASETMVTLMMVTLLMVTKSLGSASLTISTLVLRPKAMKGKRSRKKSRGLRAGSAVPANANNAGAGASTYQRRVVGGPRLQGSTCGQGATRPKPVADEAGRGMPVALAEALVPRMYATECLLSLHRAQPAQPAPPLNTFRVLPAGRTETAWAVVAGGQQSRCRGVGWNRTV